MPFGVSALVGTYVLQHLFTADEGPFLSYLLLGTALRSFMSMPQHFQPGGDVDTLHLGEAKSLKIRKRLSKTRGPFQISWSVIFFCHSKLELQNFGASFWSWLSTGPVLIPGGKRCLLRFQRVQYFMTFIHMGLSSTLRNPKHRMELIDFPK